MSNDLQIRELILTRERMSELWVQCQQIPLAWEPEFSNLQVFSTWLTAPRNVFLELVDDTSRVKGLVYSTMVQPGLSAGNVGFIAFDRVLKGREATFHQSVELLFRLTVGLRVTCFVPESRDVIAKLCQRLGFKFEGKMRRAHRNRDGRIENVEIFGLLVEDLWRFEHQRTRTASTNGGEVLRGEGEHAGDIQPVSVDPEVGPAPGDPEHQDVPATEPGEPADGSDRGSSHS